MLTFKINKTGNYTVRAVSNGHYMESNTVTVTEIPKKRLLTFKICGAGKYHVRAIADGGRMYADSNYVILSVLNSRIKRLEDLIADPERFGIFEFMRNEGTEMSAFLNSLLPADALNLDSFVPIDVEYVFNRSGRKSVSTIVKTFVHRWNRINFNQSTTTDVIFKEVSAVIRARYLRKWQLLWKTLTYDYDPYAPYQFTEKDTLEREHTVNVDVREYKDGGEDKSFTYGYNENNADGSPSDRGTREAKGESKNTRTRDNESTRGVTRSGNIGNYTIQQLTEQQREVLRYQFFDTVYADMDSVLTMPIYD